MSPGSLPELALLLAGDAAGMRSRRPKLLHPLLGKPLGLHASDLCREAGVARAAFLDEALRPLEGPSVGVVSSPAAALDGVSGPVLLLRADCPLLTREVL